MALDQLTDEKQSQLLQACATAQCQLLLGAGASMDSQAPDSQPIPGATRLARDIETRFSLAASDRDLREVVSRVVRRGHTTDLYKYLHLRFSKASPADWYQYVTALAWKRIWTLNIDDVVERAWRNPRWEKVQKVHTYSWDDPFEENDRELQIVHLHGHVHSDTPRDLIFALIEYVEAVDARRTWHSVFGDLWLQSPFIVVGAGLREEIDLARFLENRNRLQSQVAIYVVQNIDHDWREDLELWGLSVVRSSAEEFFTELGQRVKPLQRSRLSLGIVHNARSTAGLVHFGQNFRALTDLDSQAKPPRHDLLRGDYPAFSDIADNVDVQFGFSEALEADVEERMLRKINGMILLVGPPFSGKTVGLMRAAANLSKRGRTVYWFRGEAHPNPKLVVDAVKELGTPVILVVDDIGSWSPGFAQVVALATAAGQELVVVGSARSTRLPYLVSAIPQAVWDTNDIRYSAPMTRKDAGNLDAVLDQGGRLNYIQSMRRGERLQMYIREGVFNGLYRARRGEKFRERIADLYESTLRPDEVKLAFLAAVLSNFNLSVPISVAWVLLSDIQSLEADNRLQDIFDVTSFDIRLRNRSIALEYLQKVTTNEGAKEILQVVLRALRRTVNEVTIRSGSVGSEVMRALLRARYLRDLVGDELTTDLMEEMEDLYGWDGGYWEQRAINSRLNYRWSEAEGFAVKAASMIDDDRRNNTLGDVLLNRASLDSALRDSELFPVVRRGVLAFERASTKRPTNPVPILSCLAGLTHVISRRGRVLGASEVVRIQGWWGSWFVRGRQLKAFALGQLEDELDRARADWDAAIEPYV